MKHKLTAWLLALCLMAGTGALALEPAALPVEPGIDVSSWQGVIDFAQVRASGVQTVYIRAGVGGTYKDQYFERNYQYAKENGLNIGFYHYVTARTVAEAREQARFFVRLMAGTSPNRVPAMDFESFGSLNAVQVNEIARAYLDELALAGYPQAAVYGNAWTVQNIFDASLADHPLWIAEYGPSSPTTGGAWSSWAGFQYSSSGRVPGISGAVDLDSFTPALALSGTPPPPEDGQTYTVRRGDTLSAIAARFGTTVARLAELNHIADVNLIYPGQVLRLPESGVATLWYTVRPGDTLSAIARRYGTTVQDIAAINRIADVNLIYPGQRLEICPDTGRVYTVQPGDTLWGIAQRYGVTVQWLAQQNHIANPSLIYPGQSLVV